MSILLWLLLIRCWHNPRHPSVREFANLEDMNAFYAESTTELFNAYWDTEEKRTAFNDAYSKYFTGYHSDEVYREIPGGRK